MDGRFDHCHLQGIEPTDPITFCHQEDVTLGKRGDRPEEGRTLSQPKGTADALVEEHGICREIHPGGVSPAGIELGENSVAGLHLIVGAKKLVWSLKSLFPTLRILGGYKDFKVKTECPGNQLHPMLDDMRTSTGLMAPLK